MKLEFAFTHKTIRIHGTPDSPLFVAADVCEILGLDQVSRALDRLDQDERGLLEVTHPQSPSKTIARIACEIARLALPYAKDPCVLACIEVTERWIDDKATLGEVREARRAADAAAAAYAYAYAAAAAYAAARAKTKAQCCAIIRKHLPTLPGGAA